jgi:two-component system sensor histidine kinase KdpD
VGCATIAGALLRTHLAPTNLTMLYLLAVVVIALNWGRGPAVFGAALGAAAFDFFFVPPYLSFGLSDTQYLVAFLGLLVVGIVISTLAGLAKEQTQAAQRREAFTTALYALSRDLAAADGVPGIARAVGRRIENTFSQDVAVLLPMEGLLAPVYQTPGYRVDANELAAAASVYEHGKPIGREPGLSASSAQYGALTTGQAIQGVLVMRPARNGGALTTEQRDLAMAFANQAALAIERANLVQVARRVEVLRETARLQAALLDSISHDLRTPLASITGALSTLTDPDTVLEGAQFRELLGTAREQAEQMNRRVGSLLDMTRLEAGALRLRPAPVDVDELIGTVLSQFADALERRDVTVAVRPGLPSVPMDFALLVRAIANVLDNALKYSPAGSPIEIRAEITGGDLRLEVSDRGPGIPSSDVARVFDKFYRVRRSDETSGLGLGLAISAGIVQLHGGSIWAENRPGGGTTVILTVPVRRTPAPV